MPDRDGSAEKSQHNDNHNNEKKMNMNDKRNKKSRIAFVMI